MAIVNAVASGNYSNFAVTFGGIQPQPGDTVRANTFVININTDATEILFEINSSGYFQITQTEIVANGGSINLTDCDFLHNANVNNGIRISHSSGSLTFREVLVNNVSTGGACTISSSGNTTIRNIVWNAGFTTYCVLYSGSGLLNVNSVLIPGASLAGVNPNAGALLFSGSGTGNIQNAYHGIGTTNGPAHGIVYSGSGPLSVTNCYGGQSAIVSGAADGVPLLCIGSGIIRVTNAIAGNLSARPAIRNSAGSSIIYIENAIGNNFGPGGNNFQSVAYSGGNASIFSSVYVENLIFGPYGACPVSGAIFLNSVITNTVQFRLSPDGATKTLIDPSINNDVPAQADVRFGTVYQNGDRTGTLRVPTAEQVVSGVLVDNTVGTAILTTAGVESAITNKTPDIVDGVHEADLRDYDDQSHTLAWELKKLRQANPLIDFVVTDDITPTASTFSVSIADPHSTGSFEGALLYFQEGILTGDNNPILSITVHEGYSVVVLQKPLPGIPEVGDVGVIAPLTHVYSIAEIQNGLALEATSQSILEAINDIDVDFTPILDRLPQELEDGRMMATLSSTQVSGIQTTIINALKIYEVS